MLKYAKILNNETGLLEVGIGTNIDYYQSIGMVELDCEQSDIDFNWYLAEKCPKKSDETLLIEAKEEKIKENDKIRDNALNKGVLYKDILFDSDTDQKINLLATINSMNEFDSIVWFGMNNELLECNREDLTNIGALITKLHSFIWNKNAEIKQEIKNAQTIEEVERIAINYEYDLGL